MLNHFSLSSIEVWLIPLALVVLFCARILLKLILFPIRILLWLTILALPVWVYWNWYWLAPLVFNS